MAFRSFQHFVEELERAGELLRITEPVDTDLVIAEWANREMKSPGGGKALLFEKPTIDGQDIGISRSRSTPWARADAWRWRRSSTTWQISRRKFNSS